MKYLSILLLTIFFAFAPIPDGVDYWEVLAGLEYEKSTDEYGEVYLPKFSQEIRALEGKEIQLSGYIIPFEGMFKPEQLIISSLPVASCFFCGGAGPESVAEGYPNV